MPKRRSKKQGPFANLMVYKINKSITMNQQKKPAEANNSGGMAILKSVKQRSIALKLTNQGLDGCLGITEVHSRVGIEEKGVLDTGKTGIHGTLEHDNRLGPECFNDGHTIYRTGFIFKGSRINHVIS